MRASQMSKKEMNKTSNFERLSGLITQSHSNERKARLIEHYKKIKQQRWEERGQQPWAADQHLREEGGEVRASLTNNISPPTPGIASGCLRTLISDRDTHLKVNKICRLASQSVWRGSDLIIKPHLRTCLFNSFMISLAQLVFSLVSLLIWE